MVISKVLESLTTLLTGEIGVKLIIAGPARAEDGVEVGVGVGADDVFWIDRTVE